MDHRNIKRAFLLGIVLRKYNKKSQFEITQKRLFILMTVHYMNKHTHRTTKTNIWTHLDRIGRSMNSINLNYQIDNLQDHGLLTKVDSQYYCTAQCILLFTTLETMLRKERFDK